MKDTLKEIWEELNNSTITGHISGRHLILVGGKKDRKWNGAEYEENDYHYLDEWLESKFDSLIEQTIQEERERIVEIIKKFDVTRDLQGQPVTNPLIHLEDTKAWIIQDIINNIKE